MTNEYAIGIDLGTTYSVVGVVRNRNVEIIADQQGSRTTPSVVAFKASEIFVGKPALDEMSIHPTNTVYDSKRMIGRQFSDTDISEDKKIFPFRVTRGKQDRCKICIKRENCATKTYSPEETAAHVLHYLKKSAEVFIGSKVSEAVITVPAYFNNAQKEATKNAAEIVGLKVLHILAEPTAAVIKYLRDNKTEANGQKLLVLDLGGGTFDVSVVKIEQLNINVISVNGDRHLGGCDFDGVVLNFAIGEIMKKYKIDVSKDSKAIARLKIKCEKAKRTLSIDQNARIIVGSLRNSVNAEIVDVEISISRAKFNTLCKPLFERINGPIMEALKDAHFDINDIDKVITVGGSTNVVAFKEIVRKYFPDSKIVRSLNPDEAVAAGAAIYASEMSSNKNQHFEKITLNNVTPLPLGIKISGNRMHRIIDKNTRIPTTAIQKYTTTMDNQTEVEIAIYEGSGTLITENNCLGKFTLNDLSKLPKGQLEINVTFSINENCILEASAVESANGNRKSIRITRENVQFSIDEIDTLRSNFIMDCSLAEQFNKAKSLKNECEDVSRQTQWEIENQTDTYNLQSPHLNNTTNILNEYIAWSSEPHETLDIDEIKSKIRIVRLAIMPILRRPSDINDLFQGNNN